MPFKLVFLWTDVLAYVLVASVAIFIVSLRKREHLLAPWRKVARSPYGMSALVILLCFVLVGILDTFHFRTRLDSQDNLGHANYAPEVLSLLDVLASPLRTRTEKTYSEPLAVHSFAKETITQTNGIQAQEFPRLRHAGAHLDNPVQRYADASRRAIGGIGLAISLWIALSMIAAAWVAKSRDDSFGTTVTQVIRGETELPWRAMLITLGLLLVVICPVLMLSARYHVFGTDKVGQDVLYQTLKSIRTGLVIGTLTTLIVLPFALLLGVMAGYLRGWVDDIIQYVYTTLNSIPGVLLIAASVLLSQVWMDRHSELFETVTERADVRLLLLCVILGITSWTGLCRLLRGEALKLRESDYVQAAHALGVSHWRVMARHLLPNLMHIVLISIVMDFSGLVLAEAVLSYVGVGVDPSMISFGTMINNARLELAREPTVWWSLAAAFVFMFVLVLSANLFADSVRDAFDPRMRSGWSVAFRRRLANAARSP